MDRLRGLAILLMVGDHVFLLTSVGGLYRVTAGRFALPLFLLVAGALVRRFSPRFFLVLAAGVLLPVVVPWVDSPNILVLYSLGAAVLLLVERLGVPVWVIAAVSLTIFANGWGLRIGTSFDVFGVLGLVALGRLAGTWALDRGGSRLPRLLEVVGRRPVAWYLGHVLAFQVAALILAAFGAPLPGATR